MSRSSSNSATTSNTRDGRVMAEGEGIGVSSEGDVSLHMVSDEAFQLGSEAIAEISQMADSTLQESGDLASQSFNTSENLADIAFRESGDLASQSFNTSENLAEMVLQSADQYASQGLSAANSATDALQLALGRAQSSNRTEATQLSEQLIKIGIPAAAIAFAISQVWGK